MPTLHPNLYLLEIIMKKKFLLVLLITVLCASLCLGLASCKEDPCEHIWGEWVSDGSGTDTRTCTECEEKETRPTPPTNVITQTKLVTYEGPRVMSSSAVAGAKVEGKELFVYDTRVNHARSFTYTPSQDYNQVVIFDFEGSVTVEIEVYGQSTLSNVVVRPLARNVQPQVSGNKITIKLDCPDNYVVEYSTEAQPEAYKNAFHIFANPLETDAIDPNNLPAKTVYVGPGVWMANALPVAEDDTTVYLAGGAVVYGQIRTANVKNLTIRGRGILAGELYSRTKASEFTLPIELQNCTNVTIKDIAILDPAGWAVTLYKCQDVNIENLKIMTARSNGDGISVQSCQNVTVKGGFVRSWDDSLVVKNVDNSSTANITFDGVYVWTDLAQSMEVGYETHGETMDNITFNNITVLHNFHKAAMSIHNADNAKISNVNYTNITIEDAQMLGDNQLDGENDFLIDITIAFNTEWTQSGGVRGSIKNVTFDNILVHQMADSIKCRIFGEGAQSNVDGVTIKNVQIEGKEMTALEDLKLAPGVYTSNIKYTQGTTTGATLTTPYTVDLPQDHVTQHSQVSSIDQNGLVVPDFAVLDNQPPYAGLKVDTSSTTITTTYGQGDKANSPWNVGEVTQEEGKTTANLLDGDRANEWHFNAWHDDVQNEFVAVSFEFGQATQVGNIRILGTSGSNIMRYYSVSIFAKATADADWKRIQTQTDIALSPQASNYNDVLIRLSPTGYYGLQLRFFKKDDLTHPVEINIGEIEFYPPSLTTNKSFVEIAEHEDVYDITNMIDGNVLTYFESKKGTFPASFAIDLGQAENVKYINIHLPPLLLWENRTQEIEILGSTDGVTYTTVVAKAEYLFDSSQGNMASIVLDNSVSMRYIKLVFTSNSTGYGAQISELYVYGE